MSKYILLVIVSVRSFAFAMEKTAIETIVRCKSPYSIALSDSQLWFLIHYTGSIDKSQKALIGGLLRRFVFNNPQLLVQQRLLLLKSYFAPRLSSYQACSNLQRPLLYNMASALPYDERNFVLSRMPSIIFEWEGT